MITTFVRGRRRAARRSVSAVTAIAMISVGLAVTALDRVVATGPGIEAEHHAATCLPAHDHTICTQIANGLWTAPADLHLHRQQRVVHEAIPVESGDVESRVLDEGHPSRAPPLI